MKMYAVIFRAELVHPDQSYTETAARLRERARTLYGCVEFTSVTDEQREIAVSYWPDLEHIAAWKQDPEHQLAQKLGHTRWYSSYSVQVVRIERDYHRNC